MRLLFYWKVSFIVFPIHLLNYIFTIFSKPKESKSSAFMSGWLAKAKTGSPTKPGVIKQEMKPEPKKSPKKPNLMTAWLNKAKSPVKQEVKDILKTDIKAEIKQDLKEEPDIKKTKLEM